MEARTTLTLVCTRWLLQEMEYRLKKEKNKPSPGLLSRIDQ